MELFPRYLLREADLRNLDRKRYILVVDPVRGWANGSGIWALIDPLFQNLQILQTSYKVGVCTSVHVFEVPG